eukprot:comp22114_c1_seq1/m.32322 comp22114_c1_seq1/g.32322  ORF comp22114_c1_seq1/g.32322 comp22114_c1_seq1/m.32322 type:complete len:139 (-) comp22114_c1_seq1:86-502(-)
MANEPTCVLSKQTLAKLSTDALQAIAKAKGLPMEGTNQEIIHRLVGAGFYTNLETTNARGEVVERVVRGPFVTLRQAAQAAFELVQNTDCEEEWASAYEEFLDLIGKRGGLDWSEEPVDSDDYEEDMRYFCIEVAYVG